MIRTLPYKRTVLFFSIFFLFVSPVWGELLEREDIHQVMNQILKQHVNTKTLTPEVTQKSLKNYIKEFDRYHAYLLEEEVAQFLQLPQSKLQQIVREYQKENYQIFEALNNTIQKSIRRAQKIRAELFAEKEHLNPLFEKAFAEEYLNKLKEGRSYPKTLKELQENIQGELSLYFQKEQERFKRTPSQRPLEEIERGYETYMRQHEASYLFVNNRDQPLPDQESENLFVLHVLKALTHSLDSHTSVLDEDEAYDMKIRLEKGFHGVGIVLQEENGAVKIAKILEGGPAQKSELVKENDRILEINGESTLGLPLQQLIKKLRHTKEPTVHLLLEREIGGIDRKIQVILVRELIPIDEGRVEAKAIPFDKGNLGVLTLQSFYQGENGITSEKDIRKAIKNLQKEGPLKGIILDLRENSGGFLSQAVKVAGLFITNGIVVISKYSDGQERFYRDVDGKTLFEGPLVILTSRITASAAEIVAQALQDYGVAVVVGDSQTYGKGTIQSQTVTEGQQDSYFKVTIGKYYTVSGKTPQVQGVKADIIVPSHYSQELIGEEYLQSALSNDTIESNFKDALKDVEPGLRPWYLRYYLPTLQKKEAMWQPLIPALKQKSASRMSEKSRFLKGVTDTDAQMEEAVNILKDMVLMER